MQRAVRHLQEGKEPFSWCRLSRVAGLWLFPEPGLGLGLNAVSCGAVPVPLHVPAVPRFLLPHRTAASPSRACLIQQVINS